MSFVAVVQQSTRIRQIASIGPISVRVTAHSSVTWKKLSDHITGSLHTHYENSWLMRNIYSYNLPKRIKIYLSSMIWVKNCISLILIEINNSESEGYETRGYIYRGGCHAWGRVCWLYLEHLVPLPLLDIIICPFLDYYILSIFHNLGSHVLLAIRRWFLTSWAWGTCIFIMHTFIHIFYTMCKKPEKLWCWDHPQPVFLFTYCILIVLYI